jgi:ABC-2 type transport system permease protein/oleandomycin transport system permease protein
MSTLDMSTLDLQPVMGGNKLLWSAHDGWVICKRNLIQTFRAPELMVFSTIQPIMFILLFTYVFGKSVDVGPGVDYVNFLIPGIFVQTVIFGALITGIGLAEDRERGLIDRFRSLPMSRGALLVGRTLSDLLRNAVVIVVMLLVGFAVGFRFGDTTVPAVVAGFGLMLLFAFAFSWISATIGLAVGSAEAAQSGGFIWVFPLVFASSVFVRVDHLPGWLQPFSEYQPVTPVADATRALFLGGPVTSDLLQAVAWCVGILAVFGPMAVRTYRRATAR